METNREAIFRERIELMSLLVSIKNQTTDPKVRDKIIKYFGSKHDLFEELKKELPYFYHVVSPQLYHKLSAIPEDVCNLEDAILFLLDFYYKNQKMSKAQEILLQPEEIIMKDITNANSHKN